MNNFFIIFSKNLTLSTGPHRNDARCHNILLLKHICIQLYSNPIKFLIHLILKHFDIKGLGVCVECLNTCSNRLFTGVNHG